MGIPLGPYQLVKRLATGGMAEIFLARREGPEGFSRELVVKRILPHLAADPEFVQMFLAEARLAAQLHHPNVVTVYDFGHAEDAYYLAMELVRGVDLRALIGRAAAAAERTRRRGAIPPHHAAKIASLICEALAHAHTLPFDEGQRGVVHRDVTPSNVLISFDGAVKLADFGIAKAQAGVDARDPTFVGVVKGKYAYLSPEQARGERLDARSDLFNVGIVLFECLTGEALFPQQDFRQAKMLAAKGRVPELERIDAAPPALARVVRRALSPSREDRHEDALAMRAELEAFVRAWPEPSDTVELGRYVRELFPDVSADDSPRAAGTVPLTAPVTGVDAPALPLDALAPSEGDSVPTRPHARARTKQRRRILVPLAVAVALAASLGAAASQLWPEGPPGEPPRDPPRPVALPAEAPRAPAQLRVTTEPPGAAIFVDALARGAAPVVVDVEAGAHLVEARTPDDSVSGRMEVVLGAGEEREITFSAPARSSARLRVLSAPGGAAVLVDGQLLGATPLEVDVAPGRHGVEVRLPGYVTAAGDVDLRDADDRATLSFALTPGEGPRGPRRPAAREPGMLTIASSPWSEVYLGRRHLGTTPLANVPLPAGRHVLTLRHPGRPERRVTVTIEPGRVTRERVSL